MRSLEENIALGIKEFHRQPCGPCLNDDLVVKHVRKVVEGSEGSDTGHVRQPIDEMVQDKKLEEDNLIKHQFRSKPIPPEVLIPRY